MSKNTDNLIIYTDGGARGNPGPSGAGIVIFDEEMQLVKVDGKYLGVKTNNQAEYEALILALEIAQKLTSSSLTCYLDSELAVKQLNGEYKVKNEGIKPLKEAVDALVSNFESVTFKHVKREKNSFADALVNIVLDARE